MWYAPMNTNLPPFNNLKARQAVNFAIDRNAAVKLFGGTALGEPACQVLPPGFPGYEPYCPYTKNPGTRVERAGSRQGQGGWSRNRGPRARR